MNALPRKAHWLAWTAGLAFLGTGILNAQVSSPIDPVLVFSTYLGGSEQDRGDAIATDEHDNVYVTGYTNSVHFPGALTGPGVPPHPPYRPFGEAPYASDSYIAKLSSSGQLLATAFVGEERPDVPSEIAVGSSSVCVTGSAMGTDGSSAFVGVLDRQTLYSGYSFIYLTEEDYWFAGSDAAIDASGNIYVTGRMPDHLYYEYPNIGHLTFVAKLSPTGHPIYFRYLDGSSWWDVGYRIEVDGAGNVYVTGATNSPDLPGIHPPQRDYRGEFDAFVVKLDPSGEVVYSTYLGGSGSDSGLDIAVTPEGEVYLTGATHSADFPLTQDAPDTVLSGGRDLFVAKLDSFGSLVYSTYLGGSAQEEARSIGLDAAGGVFVSGNSTSEDSPLADPSQPGCHDNFIARLDLQTGSIRSFCIPGAWIWDLAVSSTGNAYATGWPRSAAFPVVNAFQPTPGGEEDAFVAKVAFNATPDCSAAAAAPDLLWPPNGKLVSLALQNITDADGDPITLKVTGVRQDEPLSRKGEPDAIGLGTRAAQVRADRASQGDGRVYHLGFEARDDKGASCTGTVKVCVPHDQRPGATCQDGGPLFDSTGR